MAEEKTKAVAVIDEVYGILKRMEPEFALALPSNVTPQKFIRVVRTALQNAPELLGARRATLYAAAMKCAQDGLIPDGKEAALVVYGSKKEDGGEVAYMPMVAGLCKKARNSGEISTIDAVVVYEKDKYNAWTDENGPHFKHERARVGDRGKPILTFSYARTKDGGLYFEEIDEAQMLAIENAAPAAKSPWKGPFKDEMRRKSAIRRLAKYRLPSSADMEQTIEADDVLFKGEPEKEVKPAEATRPSRVGAIIEAQAERTQTPPAETAKPDAAGSAQEPTIEEVPI